LAAIEWLQQLRNIMTALLLLLLLVMVTVVVMGWFAVQALGA
jgi:hypothetical protein